ncbi:energy-converting hydrogenase B subunit H EhbH [Methanobrevibacter ruminantium M1]|uniref:Energy-converting hydrogenase B subunit H EhbH n=1 Tax=Methanobrevibacter ruminantium (strain ATCC 35063 / DSM 1093 / JCM 13430 / OCM 146 / M1) TaxID=634498 RepID=D3E0D3_METRM|nr:energy-converting hydrogenase B subunit H EhbH [Methanobrevibacter ruminantium M1]
MSDKTSIRSILMVVATIIFASSLFDALYGFKNLIQPGISLVYTAIGTQLAPNMVTLVVFDWRGFDTLGESLILVTAVLVVLLIFGKGKILDKNVNADNGTADSNLTHEADLEIGDSDLELDGADLNEGDDE